jgi:hypothetical protein
MSKPQTISRPMQWPACGAILWRERNNPIYNSHLLCMKALKRTAAGVSPLSSFFSVAMQMLMRMDDVKSGNMTNKEMTQHAEMLRQNQMCSNLTLRLSQTTRRATRVPLTPITPSDRIRPPPRQHRLLRITDQKLETRAPLLTFSQQRRIRKDTP